MSYVLLEVLEYVPSNKERAIVFDALGDKLPALIDEAKEFDQEALIQFYDEWANGKKEDIGHSLGSP